MARTRVHQESGRLLLGAAAVIAIDQVTGLTSIAERWGAGGPGGYLQLAAVWAEHLTAVAILLVIATVALLLRNGWIPRQLAWVAAGLAGISIGAIGLITMGYLELVRTTPIPNPGQFQARIVRGVVILAGYAAVLTWAFWWLRNRVRPTEPGLSEAD